MKYLIPSNASANPTNRSALTDQRLRHRPGWFGIGLRAALLFLVGGSSLPAFATDLDVQQVGSVYPGSISWNVSVSGNYAYVANETNGLQVIDISDVTHPVVVANYNTLGLAYDVMVSGNHAYVADSTFGLQVIDVSNPLNPQRVGGLDTSGTVRGVFVSGNYAYLADYDQGLRIVDISDPANPTLRGTYNTLGLAWSVTVNGNYAFVADATAGLQIINVSNPALPTLTGVYNTPGYALAVEVRGNFDREATTTILRSRGLTPLPTATSYQLLPAPGGAQAFCARLLTHGIVLRDCTSFGLPGHVRIAALPAAAQHRLAAALDVVLSA